MNQSIPLRPKQKASPVTICIGFFTEDKRSGGELTLASDSRISVGSSVTNDSRKIAAVSFKNQSALLAKAGYRHAFSRFEELFADKAAGLEVTSHRVIATVAEDAIRDLQRDLLDRHAGDPAQRLLDSYCEFIIAYFYGGKPYLYTLNLISRIAEKSDGDFVAIGNGSTLANFLLTSIDVKKAKETKYEAAISVIEMCKLHDSSCGGPCRMGILGNGPRATPIIVDEAHLNSISRRMNFGKRAHAALLKGFASRFRNHPDNDARFDIDLKQWDKK